MNLNNLNELSAPRPHPAAAAALPAIVREGLVRLRHAMHIFALLHGSSAILGSLEELGRKTLRHALLRALARRINRPAHGQRHLADRTHLDRHLVGGTTDAAGLDLDHGPHVVQALLE